MTIWFSKVNCLVPPPTCTLLLNLRALFLLTQILIFLPLLYLLSQLENFYISFLQLSLNIFLQKPSLTCWQHHTLPSSQHKHCSSSFFCILRSMFTYLYNNITHIKDFKDI